MKNINKKLIIVGMVALVLSVVFGANTALAAAPTISGAAANNITQTTADISATITANGMPTAAWFDASGGNCTSNCGNVGGINPSQVITYTMTGLTANTSYSFTVNAMNGSGFAAPVTINFITASAPAPVAPSLSAVSASAVTTTSATLNGTVNPNGSATAAWFDTSGGSCTSACGNTGGINSTQTITYNLTGLTPNTTYSFQMLALNSGGPVQSSTINFTTLPVASPSAPILSAVSASAITTTSATLNGTVNPNGSATAAWFDASGGSCTSNCGNVGGINATQTITYNLTGLTPSTTYSFQMLAMNSGGPAQSATVSFTTGSISGGSAPTVSTDVATSVSKSAATLNGQYDDKSASTTTWFKWGPTMALANSTAPTVQPTSLGSDPFSDSISGLSPSTIYYYQAFAQNSNGTVNGIILSFTTSSGSGGGGGGGGGGSIVAKPQVVTALSTSVGQNTAKINGLVIKSSSDTTAWFEFGTTASLGLKSQVIKIPKADSTPISEVLSNLNPDTIYFFRAVAENKAGKVNGEIKILKTLSTLVAPVVITPSTGNGNGNPEEQTVSLKIEAAPTTVAPNDNINYTVTYKNTSEKVMKDVVVRVVMPNDIDFVSSSVGNYSDEDRTVSVNIGTLQAGEEGIITLAGKVSADAADQDVLVTTASIVFTGTAGTQGDALDYALVDVAAKNLLPAASIFGSGFLPSTLLGWMVLLLIALGLVMLGRKLYSEVNWATVLASFNKKPPMNQ